VSKTGAELHYTGIAGIWQKLASTKISGADAASISFAGIPSGFSFLQIVARIKLDTASTSVGLTCNNDGAGNYDQELFYGAAAAAGAANQIGNAAFFVQATSEWGPYSAMIGNTADAAYKTIQAQQGFSPTGRSELNSGIWKNNAAEINRLDLTVAGGHNFKVGSTFLLLGAII
jgi:hypothetical protein